MAGRGAGAVTDWGLVTGSRRMATRRAAITTAVVGAVAVCVAGAAPALASPACSVAADAVTVDLEPGASATISQGPGGEVLVDGTPCTDATVETVATIRVLGEPDAESVTIDLSGGSFVDAGGQGTSFAIGLAAGSDAATVVGAATDDHVEVTVGEVPGPAGALGALRVAAAGVETVVVTGGDGSDVIAVPYEVPGTPPPVVRLTGGTGDDAVTGGTGAEALFGGAGNDVLDGAGGDDTVADPLGNNALAGGDGDDVVRAGLDADVVAGGGGDDRVRGGGGRDDIAGGIGNDVVAGGDGADDVLGGMGRDSLVGGGDADLLRGGPGADDASGGDGRDALAGDGGGDALAGDAGIDTLRGGPGADDASGGDGRDALAGDGGGDALAGDGGIDTLRGAAGQDRLTGGTGADVMAGADGGDYLAGGAGGDSLRGGPGRDTCFKGADGARRTSCELPRSGGVLPPSPGRRVLVFEQNLEEVLPKDHDGVFLRYADMQRSREITNFARRLTIISPYMPDVLLLQEVGKSAALKTARALSARFDSPYRAVLYPKDPFWVRLRLRHGRVTGIDYFKNNTAVVVNTRTMEFKGGRYLRTPQREVDRNRNGIKTIQHQAVTRLRERASGLRMSATSIHFNSDNFFPSSDLGRRRRTEWAERVARFSRRYHPGANARVMGGEFCTKRCTDVRRERIECNEARLWRVLTGDFRYVDAVYDANNSSEADLREQVYSRAGKPFRIDYVFARARVAAASRDIGYVADKGDRNYIADHRGNWAVVGPRR